MSLCLYCDALDLEGVAGERGTTPVRLRRILSPKKKKSNFHNNFGDWLVCWFVCSFVCFCFCFAIAVEALKTLSPFFSVLLIKIFLVAKILLDS